MVDGGSETDRRTRWTDKSPGRRTKRSRCRRRGGTATLAPGGITPGRDQPRPVLEGETRARSVDASQLVPVAPAVLHVFVGREADELDVGRIGLDAGRDADGEGSGRHLRPV